jgi:hypothetical protein
MGMVTDVFGKIHLKLKKVTIDCAHCSNQGEVEITEQENK